MKKIITMILAVALVFALATTSMAYDEEEYNGECWNNFFTSSSINGTGSTIGYNVCFDGSSLWNYRDTYYIGTSAYNDYTSRLYKNGYTSVPVMGILWMAPTMADDYHESTITTICSSYWFKVSNSHTSYKLHAEGAYGCN